MEPEAQPEQTREWFSAIVPLSHVDVRSPDETAGRQTWTMSGYAAVFNQQAVYLDSKFLRIILEVDQAAFDGVLRTQQLGQPDGVVHFNLGHDMNRVVASTDVPSGQPGSLQLSADAHGLRYLARVSKDDPDGVAMAVKMRDGVIRQASMAFTAARNDFQETEQEDGQTLVLRRILEVGHLYDVCATPQGVFSQTVSELQQYAAPFMGQPDAMAFGVPAPQPGSPGDGISVSPNGSGVAVVKPRLTGDLLARIASHRR